MITKFERDLKDYLVSEAVTAINFQNCDERLDALHAIIDGFIALQEAQQKTAPKN